MPLIRRGVFALQEISINHAAVCFSVSFHVIHSKNEMELFQNGNDFAHFVAYSMKKVYDKF